MSMFKSTMRVIPKNKVGWELHFGVMLVERLHLHIQFGGGLLGGYIHKLNDHYNTPYMCDLSL